MVLAFWAWEKPGRSHTAASNKDNWILWLLLNEDMGGVVSRVTLKVYVAVWALEVRSILSILKIILYTGLPLFLSFNFAPLLPLEYASNIEAQYTNSPA